MSTGYTIVMLSLACASISMFIYLHHMISIEKLKKSNTSLKGIPGRLNGIGFFIFALRNKPHYDDEVEKIRRKMRPCLIVYFISALGVFIGLLITIYMS